jgi:hypothetical protein
MCCIIVTKNPFLTHIFCNITKKQMLVINARKKKKKPKKDVLGGA